MYVIEDYAFYVDTWNHRTNCERNSDKFVSKTIRSLVLEINRKINQSSFEIRPSLLSAMICNPLRKRAETSG